jgi:branched-chain amino acid transport system ATP-binding protein
MAVGWEIDLRVDQGEVVALLGPNGAGKSTLLMTVAGALRPLGGVIRFGTEGDAATLERRVAQGLALVPQERSVFSQLSVRDNLRLGKGKIEDALALFPELETHLNRRAGLLSGGQQQMLALGRALATKPRLLLVDELSLGLAPQAVDRLLSAVRQVAYEGVGVLLVEQQLAKALAVSDRYMVIRRGRIVLEGTSKESDGNFEKIREAYLE